MLYRIWPFLTIVLFTAVFYLGPSKAQTIDGAKSAVVQQVIRDQLSAFKSREHERAFSHAAPNIRSIFKTTDQFINMVKNGYSAIYNSSSYSFARSRTEAGVIHQEVIIIGPNGKEWQAIYSLQEQDDGSWKIMGVQMNPYSGATT